MQDSLNIIQDATISEDSVEHYGVLGMKWGHRKQYAQSHNMTTKQLRKQIKADNREAFEIGKRATIADYTTDKALYKQFKAQKKYNKRPTKKNQDRLKRANLVLKGAKENSIAERKNIANHHKKLIEKYGKEHISNIKTNKLGMIDENVNSSKTKAILAGVNFLTNFAANFTLAAMGSPVRTIGVVTPKSKHQYAREEYRILSKGADNVLRTYDQSYKKK